MPRSIHSLSRPRAPGSTLPRLSGGAGVDATLSPWSPASSTARRCRCRSRTGPGSRPRRARAWRPPWSRLLPRPPSASRRAASPHLIHPAEQLALHPSRSSPSPWPRCRRLRGSSPHSLLCRGPSCCCCSPLPRLRTRLALTFRRCLRASLAAHRRPACVGRPDERLHVVAEPAWTCLSGGGSHRQRSSEGRSCGGTSSLAVGGAGSWRRVVDSG